MKVTIIETNTVFETDDEAAIKRYQGYPDKFKLEPIKKSEKNTDKEEKETK